MAFLVFSWKNGWRIRPEERWKNEKDIETQKEIGRGTIAGLGWKLEPRAPSTVGGYRTPDNTIRGRIRVNPRTSAVGRKTRIPLCLCQPIIIACATHCKIPLSTQGPGLGQRLDTHPPTEACGPG